MNCPKCHIENPADNKFCRECGEALRFVCDGCGHQLQAGDKFCGQCGQKVFKAAKEETIQLATEGERKHVTVLFSDLSGYTAMSEKLDPEEVKEITGQIFGDVSKIIAKYDGFVEKYAGDAVMALFGVPRAHEDDPLRAIKAACEIHERVNALNPEIENKIGRPISMHSGINTGLVVTGEVNMDRGTHGVAGDTINVAARLSTTAKADDILVDHQTYKRSEGFFQFEDLAPLQLKGKAKPVQVHKYLAVKKLPQKVHRLHGLRAELIGRKAEMAQLSEAVENLKQGKGAVISIIGTAGTGKSRLVEEFKASLDLRKIQWREGNAFAYAQNIPYIPLIDLISKAIQVNEGDPPEAVKEKLGSSLKALFEEKSEIEPYIGSLFALEYPEISEVSPEFWKAELQKATLKVLTALAQRAPTVICLEDLHWADPSSIELVHFLLSEIRHPVLFLCVYRPSTPPFSAHRIKALAIPHQELRLQDLSLSEAQNMVESLLQTDAIPGDLQQFIRNKVEGNPFYLEEAINSLIESKILVPENGDWKVEGPITESEISATIQGVISARVDRLEHESKRILQEASVIGRSFYHEILKRISEIKDTIDTSLRGLERFDLIKTKSVQPYLEYIFKHALTQEVVYNGLLKKERREIHERIGFVIEELFKDRLPEFYETLAFHFKNGHSIDKAVHYLMKSGEKSLKRYSVEESHQYYKEAYTILIHTGNDTSENSELIIHLIVDWALVFYYRGDFKGLNELLKSHEDIVAALEDKFIQGMFYAWFGNVLYFRARFKDSYQYLIRALEIGGELNDPRVMGYACAWLAFTCTDLGLHSDALKYGLQAHEQGKELKDDQYLYFKSLAGLSYANFSQGYGKKCKDFGNKLLDYGKKNSNIRCQVVAHISQGQGYFSGGNLPESVESFEKGVAIAADPFYSIWAKSFLGPAYMLNNQHGDAEKILNEVLNYSSQYGFEVIVSYVNIWLGLISIIKGNMSKGIKMIEGSRQFSIESERKGWMAFDDEMLGNVYSQIAQGGEKPSLSFFVKNIGFLIKNAPLADRKAVTHFNKAIEHAKAAGDNGTLGRTYLNLGLLHKTKKRNDKAKECFLEAIKVFEETEADVFLKQTREALEGLEGA